MHRRVNRFIECWSLVLVTADDIFAREDDRTIAHSVRRPARYTTAGRALARGDNPRLRGCTAMDCCPDQWPVGLLCVRNRIASCLRHVPCRRCAAVLKQSTCLTEYARVLQKCFSPTRSPIESLLPISCMPSHERIGTKCSCSTVREG